MAYVTALIFVRDDHANWNQGDIVDARQFEMPDPADDSLPYTINEDPRLWLATHGSMAGWRGNWAMVRINNTTLVDVAGIVQKWVVPWDVGDPRRAEHLANDGDPEDMVDIFGPALYRVDWASLPANAITALTTDYYIAVSKGQGRQYIKNYVTGDPPAGL